MANNLTNIVKIMANDLTLDHFDQRFESAGGYAQTNEGNEFKI